MGRKKRIQIDDGSHPVEFVTVANRPMETIEIDLTKTEGTIAKYENRLARFEGAIVRPIFRVRADNIDQANALIADMMKTMRTVAHHVRRPEVQVVKVGQVRAPKMKQGMDAKDAVKEYLKVRPPTVADPEAVMDMVLELSSGVVFGEGMPQPKSWFLNHVVMQDFMPFGGTFDCVLEQGVYAVTARYDGEVGASNRAGKSAFIDAVLFALYGKTGRRLSSNNKVIHRGKEDATAAVAIDTGPGPSQLVSRQIGKKSLLRVGVVTGVSNGQPVIERIVGLNFDDFVKTCFVRQGDLHGLLGETSAPIQNALMRWTGVDAWTDIHKTVAGSMAAMESRLKSAQNELADTAHHLSRFDPLPTQKMVDKANKAWTAATSDEDPTERLEELQKQLKQAKRLEELKLKAKPLRAFKKAQANNEKVLSGLDIEYQTAVSDLTEHTKKATAASKLCHGGFDGVCPVDSDECPRAEEINHNGEVLDQKLVVCLEKKDEVRAVRDEVCEQREAVLDESEELKSSVEKAFGADAAVKEMKDWPLVETIEAEINVLTKKADDLPNTDEYREAYDDAVRNLDRYNELVKRKNNAEKSVNAIEKKLKVVRYVALMCSRKGIPAFQMESAVSELEAQANEVLEKVGLPVRVEFKFGRELGKLTDVCPDCGAAYPKTAKVKFCEACGAKRGNAVNDDLVVNVLENGQVQEFEQDSGGGKALVALAVRIALCRFLGARVLFLDEVCGMLDVKNVAALVQVLGRLPDVGFEQVFVISHRQEVADALSKEIRVTRYQDEGRSEIEVV
jgi:DNA repair exonuclease SbcCD ATPase subunit